MKYLSAQQLGVLLGIPKSKARDKMVHAWLKFKEIEVDPFYNAKGKDKNGKPLHRDPYPVAMETEMLAKNLNIPLLPDMVKDISENYLQRKSTRGYILGYANAEVERKLSKGASIPISVSVPPDIRSFLSHDVIEEIHKEWRVRLAKWGDKVIIK